MKDRWCLVLVVLILVASCTTTAESSSSVEYNTPSVSPGEKAQVVDNTSSTVYWETDSVIQPEDADASNFSNTNSNTSEDLIFSVEEYNHDENEKLIVMETPQVVVDEKPGQVATSSMESNDSIVLNQISHERDSNYEDSRIIQKSQVPLQQNEKIENDYTLSILFLSVLLAIGVSLFLKRLISRNSSSKGDLQEDASNNSPCSDFIQSNVDNETENTDEIANTFNEGTINDSVQVLNSNSTDYEAKPVENPSPEIKDEDTILEIIDSDSYNSSSDILENTQIDVEKLDDTNNWEEQISSEFVPIIDDEDISIEPKDTKGQEDESIIQETIYEENDEAITSEQEIVGEEEHDDFIPILEDGILSAINDDEDKKTHTIIYLGIDFGTTFTKLSYLIDQNNRDCIKLSGKYFIPSVIYSNGKCFSMKKKSAYYVPLKYFKFNMMPQDDNKRIIDPDTKLIANKLSIPIQELSLLSSVFYLVNIIQECSNKVGNGFFSINLGVPYPPDRKDIRLFETVLFVAASIVRENRTSEIEDVSILSTLYEEYREKLGDGKIEDYLLTTTPEIVAEADYLLSRQTYSLGDYMIIDVGGGTTDFAYIRKNQNGYDAIYYDVEPLGYETKEKFGDREYLNQISNAVLSFIKTCRKLVSDVHKEATVLLFGGGIGDNQIKDKLLGTIVKTEVKKYYGFTLLSDDRPFPNDYFLNKKLDDFCKKRLVITTQLSNPNPPEITTNPVGKDCISQDVINKNNNTPIISRTKKQANTYYVVNGVVVMSGDDNNASC